GIRDRNVTGVQTCALPISLEQLYDNINNHHNETMMMIMLGLLIIINLIRSEAIAEEAILLHMIAISMFIFYFLGRAVMLMTGSEIGRASCREEGGMDVRDE